MSFPETQVPESSPAVGDDRRRSRVDLAVLIAAVLVTAGLLYTLSRSLGPIPPMGVLLDPIDGLYRTARAARYPAEQTIRLEMLDAPVTVLRDNRGVAHIFASTDRDGVIALGLVVASDRLFQLDFIPRVAAGRLSSAFGAGSVPADRFLRQTGMDWGARRNLERIMAAGGIERDLLEWFGLGVNAYIDQLTEADLPLEFRLLGYRPDRYHPLQTLRLLQYMTYDLTYRSDDASYGALRLALDPEEYERLFPRDAPLSVPIIPEDGAQGAGPSHELVELPAGGDRSQGAGPSREAVELPAGGAHSYGALDDARKADPKALDRALAILAARAEFQQALAGTPAEGFLQGKGSNNWAVAPSRSSTGSPILAGDMHLGLNLPSIWYEVHLVTPSINSYGVTVPGAPLPVEAFNDKVGWAFTNTGSDQIDHLALELDATGRMYRFEGEWMDLVAVQDTIEIKGGDAVIDTLYYAHWGPVIRRNDGAVALRWVAHDSSRTLSALWGMNRAASMAEFQTALQYWDGPMQNVLAADVDGNIAIRSTGYMPVRRSGDGAGLLDGSSDAHTWVGRVPFDELPFSLNPEQGFLSSTNQQPTGANYAHYLGHDWRDGYRSIRINSLLESRQRHGVEDLMRYQSDVYAVQHGLFISLVDTLAGLSPGADSLRLMLSAWDGETHVDRVEPLVLHVFLDALAQLTWDEPPFRADDAGIRRDGERERRRTVPGIILPSEAILYRLLTEEPTSPWLDIRDTPQRETAADVLRMALEETAEELAERYGRSPEAWRWGSHHKIVFRHLTESGALRPLWRGPFEFPGFRETLSPAANFATTHSASWRVVVDFSEHPPRGYGVYPGGQSGSPFSHLYDRHLETYLAFEHFQLIKPSSPEGMPAEQVASTIRLVP